MVTRSKNTKEMLDRLISRDGYVSSQDNGMSGSFASFTVFEHKMFDYCVSFIRPDSKIGEEYTIDILEVLKYFNLTEGGENYKRVIDAIKKLKYTPLYLPKFKMEEKKKNDQIETFFYDEDGKRVLEGWFFTSIFGEKVSINFDGTITFNFSNQVSPYLYKLNSNFYQLRMRDIRPIKGKYELILLKLWQARQNAKRRKQTIIRGSIDEWQDWYLGKEKRKPSNIFKRDMLDKSRKQLEKDFEVSTELKRITKGRKLIGYEMIIIEN